MPAGEPLDITQLAVPAGVQEADATDVQMLSEPVEDEVYEMPVGLLRSRNRL